MTEITEETIAELERLGSLADAGPVLIERRDDDDGSLDYVLYGPIGDVAVSFETVNNNARANADHLAALRNAAPQLIAAARRSLEYEAFFATYGAVTGKALLGQRDIRLGNGHTGAAAAYDAALHEFTALLERLPK